jgi:RNA polymerase sigma factor (sigma-70 family)
MSEQLDHLIKLCLKGERNSQRQLYEWLGPKMLVVCMRYSRNKEEAEDTLQEGFIKVFENLGQFRHAGSFEGWVRKIMVNCSLQKFRNKPQLHAIINIDEAKTEFTDSENISAQLGTKELLKMVQQLPPACRMVFNLYVFEGMKHREIAEQLGISEGTSKSNLSDARVILQKAVATNSLIARQNIN